MATQKFYAKLKYLKPADMQIRAALRLFGDFIDLINGEKVAAIDEGMESPTLLSNIGLQTWAEDVRRRALPCVWLESTSSAQCTVLTITYLYPPTSGTITLKLHVLWNDPRDTISRCLEGELDDVLACGINAEWMICDKTRGVLEQPAMDLQTAVATLKARHA